MSSLRQGAPIAGFACAVAVGASWAQAESSAAIGPCTGHFPNLMTDICWMCVFPISIGSATVDMDQQDDGDPAPDVCECPEPPPVFEREGIGISYWEPARLAEVVRTPYCSPTLGSTISSSTDVAAGTHSPNGSRDTRRTAFYQVHWYSFPILDWIGAAITSANCESSETFDLSYATELDPMWSDDALTTLIDPEAVLFENPISQAACIADALSAAVGFGIDALFWCSGSWGSVFPLDGEIARHDGGIDSSMLEVHRMAFKLHSELLADDTSTDAALCGPVPQPIMRKGQYKLSPLFPIPKTDTAVPLGQQTLLWVAGREFPYQGEDFTYTVWRKRLCCAY